MKKYFGAILFCLLFASFACKAPQKEATPDWLLKPEAFKAKIELAANRESLTLGNELIRRTFRLVPDCATVDYQNLMTGEAILRAVRPEAVLVIDGNKVDVGGLAGQPDQAYLLPRWLDSLTANPDAFHYSGYEKGETQPRFPYPRKRWAEDRPWPPPGKALTLHFQHASPDLRGITVDVHYEIYDGLPLIAKWLSVSNACPKPVVLNSFISENLAVVEPEVSVGTVEQWDRPNIQIESDFAFNGMTPKSANRTAYWVEDPSFTSQVNYELKTPCVLESHLPLGPEETLDSYQAHLVQNFGYGVQACYRGTRLYDTDQTKALVKKWVDWYKKYRAILNSDVVHLRRPDGRDLDAVLHVNAGLKEKGFALVFNPTDRTVEKIFILPLYYTGLTDEAKIREQEGETKTYRLDRKYEVLLSVKVGPDSFSWFVIE